MLCCDEVAACLMWELPLPLPALPWTEGSSLRTPTRAPPLPDSWPTEFTTTLSSATIYQLCRAAHGGRKVGGRKEGCTFLLAPSLTGCRFSSAAPLLLLLGNSSICSSPCTGCPPHGYATRDWGSKLCFSFAWLFPV